MTGAARDIGDYRPGSLGLARWDAAFIALVLLASGGGSLWLGQDLSFDLLSYHFYNGYALVEGRLDRDIAPVGWHTYISPLMDALSYLGMVGLPPRVFGFVFGVLHGLNVVLVYLLGLVVLAPSEARQARLLAGLAALVGGLGPNAVSLLGTSAGNNLVSIPVLGALLLLLWPLPDAGFPRQPHGWSNARLFAAATLCGVASGLRLTAAVDHLAVCLVVLAFTLRGRSIRGLLRALASLGAGSLLGFLAVNGIWSAKLLERFGNPLFPFANQIFRSPFFKTEFLRDARWIARGVLDYLTPPLDVALGRMDRLQEIGARDARYLVLFVAVVVFALFAFARSRRASAPTQLSPAGSLLLAYWFVSYGLWAAAFYYYRYMTTLEFLAPVALLVIARTLAPRRALLPVAAAFTLALAAWARSDSWGRGEWRSNWFGVELPTLARQPGAMVLLTGAPISFALPDFPEDARFVHLTALREKGGTELFDQKIVAALSQHQGPLLMLSSFRVDKHAQDPSQRRPRWVYNPEEDAGPVAERFGLALTDHCEDMRTRRGRLYLCQVERKLP